MSAPIIKIAKTSRHKCPLHVPFRVAYGSTEEADLTFVYLGHETSLGVGEAAPASYLSAKEKDSSSQALGKFAQQLVGQTFEQAIEQLSRRLQSALRQPQLDDFDSLGRLEAEHLGRGRRIHAQLLETHPRDVAQQVGHLGFV